MIGLLGWLKPRRGEPARERSAFEAADAEKEDDGDFPGTREQRAEARNVQLCPRSQECQAQSQPNTLSCHPIAKPARVPNAVYGCWVLIL